MKIDTIKKQYFLKHLEKDKNNSEVYMNGFKREGSLHKETFIHITEIKLDNWKIC